MVGSVEDEARCGFNLAIPIPNFIATTLSMPFYPSYPITNYSSIGLCLKIATMSDVNIKILLLNMKKKGPNLILKSLKIFISLLFLFSTPSILGVWIPFEHTITRSSLIL